MSSGIEWVLDSQPRPTADDEMFGRLVAGTDRDFDVQAFYREQEAKRRADAIAARFLACLPEMSG